MEYTIESVNNGIDNMIDDINELQEENLALKRALVEKNIDIDTDKYLVSYEYEGVNGRLIEIQTRTNIFTLDELRNIKSVGIHDGHFKILFCQKL